MAWKQFLEASAFRRRSIHRESLRHPINNSCNPTGALYTRQEISDLLSVAKERNLMVISDEVYSEIVFDGAKLVSCASFPEHRSRVIIIESCSKNFAMAGWRWGFLSALPG